MFDGTSGGGVSVVSQDSPVVRIISEIAGSAGRAIAGSAAAPKPADRYEKRNCFPSAKSLEIQGITPHSPSTLLGEHLF